MRNYIPKTKRIPRGAYLRITSVIYDYNTLKKELDEFQQQGNKKYNPTRENELKRKINAFERVWERTDEERQKIIRLKFFIGKTYRDMQLPMDDRTAQRYVGDFLRDLGRELGEIN